MNCADASCEITFCCGIEGKLGYFDIIVAWPYVASTSISNSATQQLQFDICLLKSMMMMMMTTTSADVTMSYK